MTKQIIFLSEDMQFVRNALKFISLDVDWVATADLSKVRELLNKCSFDYAIIKNKDKRYLFSELNIDNTSKYIQSNNKTKIILLHRLFWKNFLKKSLNK